MMTERQIKRIVLRRAMPEYFMLLAGWGVLRWIVGDGWAAQTATVTLLLSRAYLAGFSFGLDTRGYEREASHG